MEHDRAQELLTAERRRVEQLLSATTVAGDEDREAANDAGDMADPAEHLTDEEGADAVAESLRQRLLALDRADQRLREGSFGRSVRSGVPIPDDRLEADPAAELTIEEARSG
jgi:DnaK suppressor protein